MKCYTCILKLKLIHDDSLLLHPIPLCKIIDLSTFHKSRKIEYSNLMIEVIIPYVFISNFPLPGQPKYINRDRLFYDQRKKSIIGRSVCYDRQIKSIFAMKYYPDMYRIPNSQFAITTTLTQHKQAYAMIKTALICFIVLWAHGKFQFANIKTKHKLVTDTFAKLD